VHLDAERAVVGQQVVLESAAIDLETVDPREPARTELESSSQIAIRSVAVEIAQPELRQLVLVEIRLQAQDGAE
jgi:hypothetical protein